ncbi:hypothetical protein B0919_17615 [Hymenobacter sp. CRA2]|nr:hypothetical protein B0919_17615 [Hymenobacter sp. CRA2]
MVNLRATFEQVLRMLVRQGTGKVLIDRRLLHAMSEEEQQWITTQWLPRAMAEGGYRYAAWLPSRNVMTRLAAQQVVARVASRGPVYRLCETEAEAIAWLSSQP